jgi:hypothetical protein
MDAKNVVLYCKAALPSLEDKKQAWKEITENSLDLSDSQVREIMSGFAINRQNEESMPFLNEHYFKDAVSFSKKNPRLSDKFLKEFLPDK